MDFDGSTKVDVTGRPHIGKDIVWQISGVDPQTDKTSVKWWATMDLLLEKIDIKYWLALVGLLLLFSLPLAQASDVTRPSIWTNNTERLSIIRKVNTEPWAKAVYFELGKRASMVASDDLPTRKYVLEKLPLIWINGRNSPPTLPKFRVMGGGSNAQRTAVVKALQDGIDCGVMYFLTEEEKFAKCGADILYTVINALKQMEVQKGGAQNSGWMFPTDHLYEARVIGAQLPIIYDFVYSFLKKGGKVYDLASNDLVEFNIDDAQQTFQNYVWLALNRGLYDSNWPVLESASLVHNIMALDDSAEIKKYLPYYTHIDTKHQASLKKVAENFPQEGDIWPESFGYSKHVSAFSVYLMTLLDRYDSKLKLGEKYPNIPASFKSYYDLQYPNNEYPYIGDGSRRYGVAYSALEMSYLLAKMNNNQAQFEFFGNYLASSMQGKKYDRGVLKPRSYGPSPYYTPTQLLWYDNKIQSAGSVDITRPRPRTKRLEFAGMNIQRNISKTDPVKNSLMGFVSGGSYIHGHATGMDIELYGQGHVLGVDGGKGTYRSDLHENYYRLFAAHNSVISNGASASKGDWINLGINRVQSVITEPALGEAGVSPNHSVTTSTFFDEYNLVAPAEHERTLAIIRLSDYHAYYLDIFKAKSHYEQQFHDYVYHNIGDTLQVTTNNKNVIMSKDTERFQASKSLTWIETGQRGYRHPGWHFFEDIASSGQISAPTEVTFEASKLGDKSILMKAFMPAQSNIQITTAMAPKAHGASKPYNKLPLPTMVVRQVGEAWERPFVVAFESITEGENYAIQSIENLVQNRVFKGVKVALEVDGKSLTHYILAQGDSNDIYQDNHTGLYFKGRFALVSIDKNQQARELYIGNGELLKIGDHVLTADTKNHSAYAKID